MEKSVCCRQLMLYYIINQSYTKTLLYRLVFPSVLVVYQTITTLVLGK